MKLKMAGNVFLNSGKILFTLFIAALISCNNLFNTPNFHDSNPVTKLPGDGNSEGTLIASLFIPDYGKISLDERIVAPQTAKARLSIRGTGSYYSEYKTLTVDQKDIVPIGNQGAPESLPGGVWTGAFTSLKAGIYAYGSLKIELLDINGIVLTEGYNDETYFIDSTRTVTAAFFTVPVMLTRTGVLNQGEMKFWKISMDGETGYELTMEAEGSWPDIVIFNYDGTYCSYHSISGAGDAVIEFDPKEPVSYYVGVYADDGDVSSYTINFKPKGDTSDDPLPDDESPDDTPSDDDPLPDPPPPDDDPSPDDPPYDPPPDDDPTPPDDPPDDPPISPEGDIILENFENSGSAVPAPWTYSGTVTVTNQAAEKPANPWFGNNTRFLKMAGNNAGTTLQRTVNLKVNSALTFSFRTEINNSSQAFRVYVDGVEQDSYRGSVTVWRNESVLLPAGERSIRFELSSGSTGSAVYMDNVNIVPDETVTVALSPRGNLNAYVGAPENEKIKFSGQALRSDGSVRKNVTGYRFSGNGIDSVSGLFTPQAAGNTTVSVSVDGKTTSKNVTVHPADYMRRPFFYPGTGKTYNGFQGTESTRTAGGGVTVIYPAESSFNADGFFTIEGSVNNSAVYNYALIKVEKDGNSTLNTSYLVRGVFKTRVWLRFGPGAYTINVYGLSSITLASQLGAEGDYFGYSYSGSSVSYKVNNTRNDDFCVDGSIPDKRFIYPSYLIQSDDFRISNLAADLTFGLDTENAKAKAIHDYIVTNTFYDMDSTESSRRKKQDAITVLGTRYHEEAQYNPEGHYFAVCEGYANLYAALSRALGMEAKFISSDTMNHGWNNAFVNGGWKLVDATWDDPLRLSSGIYSDFGPLTVGYSYFLLSDLTDGGSHISTSVDSGRAAIGPSLPRHRGAPDGWY